MMHLGSDLDLAAGAMAALGAWAVLRVTALLAGALALAWLARRSSGHTRHTMWSVTFAALLALPALTWVLPRIPVAVPRLEMPRALSHTGTAHEAPALADAAEDPTGSDGGAEPRSEGSGASRVGASTSANIPTSSGGSGDLSAPAGGAASPLATLVSLLSLLWLAGAVSGTGALLLGLWRAGRANRRGSPITDAAWQSTLHDAARTLDIGRPVALRSSRAVALPMAGGFLRPFVLLPESARSWTEERRKLVLLHELVHVSRADVLRQVVSRLVVSLYWFHPLVWWAARHAALAREVACDEAVLALGHRPSTYARHLVDLAEPAWLPLPALARRRRPDLEKRVMLVLHPRAGRSNRRIAVLLVAPCAALWALSVAALSPRAEEAAAMPLEAWPGAAAVVALPASPAAASAAARTTPPTPSGLPPSASTPGSEPTPQQRCWSDSFQSNFSRTYFETTDDPSHKTVVRYGSADEDRMIQTNLEDLRLCLRSHGPVELSEHWSRVVSIGPGGWLVMAAQDAKGTQQLELNRATNGTRPRWTINGTEHSFDAGAQRWRDAMLELLGTRWQISSILGRVSTLQGEISSVRGRESSLRGEIASIRGHVASLRGEIASIRGRESSRRGEISSIRGRVSSMRGEIASIRGHVSSMRGEISSLRGRITGLQSAMRATRDEATQARLAAEIDDAERAIADVQRRIEEYDADSRVAEVQQRLEAYDADSRVREVEDRQHDENVDEQIGDIEQRIDEYDADARIREVEARLRELDVDGEVARIEKLIAAEDADRRIAELEKKLGPAERRLVKAVRAVR